MAEAVQNRGEERGQAAPPSRRVVNVDAAVRPELPVAKAASVSLRKLAGSSAPWLAIALLAAGARVRAEPPAVCTTSLPEPPGVAAAAVVR